MRAGAAKTASLPDLNLSVARGSGGFAYTVLPDATAPADATHIVKFHGTFDDDASLVLTESSYFDRLEFESAIDIKLRAN